MENKVLYHKKFKRAEVTVTKNTWKETVSSLAGLAVVAGLIWYFFFR